MEQCVICVETHRRENHSYRVTRYGAKKGKIWIYVVSKYANCGGNHQVTTFRCPARQKALALAWKNTPKKALEENSGPANKRLGDRKTSVESQEDKEVTSKPLDMKLDTSTD